MKYQHNFALNLWDIEISIFLPTVNNLLIRSYKMTITSQHVTVPMFHCCIISKPLNICLYNLKIPVMTYFIC